MASEDPSDEPTEPLAYDTLRRLERRLDEASAAAQRLIAEAARTAAGAGPARTAAGAGPARSVAGAGPADSDPEDRPPPAGWQRRQDPNGAAGARDELEPLAQFLRSARELIPPELQRRLAEALRELLLALRALIDWYLERIDRRRAEPVQVQDIPIT